MAVPEPQPDPTRLERTVRLRPGAAPEPIPPTELERDPATAPPDAHFGKYVRVRRLGQGGMGEVWKAWDSELKRWVALKFLTRMDEALRARFRREAEIAGGLSHPNIAAVYDVGEAQGRDYMAMRFVEGRTLRAWPARDRRELVALMRDAARGVAYAHSRGIIHRDLKPDNLMVEAAESGPCVQILDFGLAKPAHSEIRLSLTGEVVGTVPYMSPQQADGQDLDHRTDIYSLGATLYDVITGRPPFDGRTPAEVQVKVITEEPPAPRTLDPSIEPDLETIILKALEKDPERRYATAGDMADDLQRWLEGEAIRARPPSLAYRVRKFVWRRRQIVVPVAAGLVLSLSIAGFWMARELRRRTQAEGECRRAAELEAAGDYVQAQAAYTAALAFSPAHPKAAEGRERSGRLQAEREKARAEAGALLERARLYFERADRLFRERDSTFEEIQAETREARKLAEAAATKDPALATARFVLARVLELDGDEEGAEAALVEARRLDPGLGPARLLLGRLLAARAWFQSLSAEEASRKAQEPGARRLADEAKVELEAGIAAGSGVNDELELLLAECIVAHLKPDRERVLALSAEGIRRFPRAPGIEELHWIRALSQTGADQLASLDRALEIRPKYRRALYCRANTRFGADDLKGAIADFGALISIHPTMFHAYAGRALARGMSGDLDGCIEDASVVLKGHPDDRVCLMNRAYAKLLKKDFPGAIADYNTAASFRPDDSAIYVKRGDAHRQAGNAAAALADYQAALARLEAGNPERETIEALIRELQDLEKQ